MDIQPEYKIKFLPDHEIFSYGVFINDKFIWAGSFEECCEKKSELYFNWLLGKQGI